jgi:DNA/RNA-binding domain of Phe-tRNA-synthetase-like protein
MQEICDRKRAEFTVESLAEAQPVREVRAMFREWDMDPSKYRPASEALLRRVVQGKGLYRVSNVVDVGNLCSIETGWPFGCYDRDKIKEPVVFRHGAAGEQYEGIGKRTWHLEGRPVLADPDGPFGSPISDSTRSMITEAAHEILRVIYVLPVRPIHPLRRRWIRLPGACRYLQVQENLASRFAVDARAGSLLFVPRRVSGYSVALRRGPGCPNSSSFSCYTLINQWEISTTYSSGPTPVPTCHSSKSSRGILLSASGCTIPGRCLNGSSAPTRNISSGSPR